MIELSGWRRWLTCATVDAVLVCAAGAAMAAPVTALTAPAPALPILLVLGVGLMGATLRRGVKD